MKRSLIGVALAFCLVAPLQAAADGHGDEERPGLMTIITSDSNETQAMALILATHYVRAGSPARILLCDAAGEMAVEGAEMGSTTVEPAGRAPREMLRGLIDAEVTVEVCAIFLPGRGLDESALVDGVGVAQPPAIAEVMGSSDWRLFTF